MLKGHKYCVSPVRALVPLHVLGRNSESLEFNAKLV